MDDPTGTVPQRPHTHMLMRLARSVTSPFYTQSLLVVRKQAVTSICLLNISFLPHSLIPHTTTYLLIYHLHAHMHLFWRLPTGLVIAAPLFCIHMRESQHTLFLSLFLSYEYKIVKAESKETWEISSISLRRFLWHLIELFYLVKRGGTSVKKSLQL